MKKFMLICMIWFAACCIYAGVKRPIRSKEIIIGRNYTSNAGIPARRFDFPERIERWSLNDSANMLTLQLRGTTGEGNELKDSGSILLFDLPGEHVEWEQDVDYQKSTFDQYDHVLIRTTGNQASCLNDTTGEGMWNVKNSICYVHPKRGIGAGFKFADSGELTNSFEGVDLTTGKSIWKRKINREYNVNEVLPLNDSTIVISANGLHAIHLGTGAGWDYGAFTGKKDYTQTVLSNLFNIVLSILLKTDYIIVTGHDLITGTGSNTLVDSTGIYLADNRSVVRLDKQGKVVWKSSLPSGLVSRSTLFTKDSLVCMVNDGFASYNYEMTNYGKPFVAAYSRNTGKNVFLTRVGYKKDQILSFEIMQDTMFVLAKSRIFKYSLTDGSELWEKPFKSKSIGELTQFSGTGIYTITESGAMKPLLADSTNIYVFNNRDQLLELDHQFDIKSIIPNGKLCYCYLETNGYRFIDDGAATLVTDKNNKPVAMLDISGNTLLIGKKLYEVQGNSLVEIDVRQLGVE